MKTAMVIINTSSQRCRQSRQISSWSICDGIITNTAFNENIDILEIFNVN